MVCQAKEGVEQNSCTAFSGTDDYAVLPMQGDTVFMRDINLPRYCYQYSCRSAGICHRVGAARSYKHVKRCNLVNCPNSFALQLVSQYPFSLDAQNNNSANFIMQFSAAYMVVDFFLFLLPFTPDDFLFVGHHLMTTGYMMSSLFIGRGGLSCLVLMVLGESTSLFQNSWLISRELRQESRAAMSCFNNLSPIYTYVFLLVRSMVAPPVIAWFCIQLQSAQKLPIGCRVTWASLAAVTTAGSQIWSYKLWKGLKRQSAKHKADVMQRPKSV
ncbi:TPA: hypothetical protein ACH3X1_005013 [Trebouxia sp. C0004]